MKAKEIIYERTVSENFNNRKVGIVIELEPYEKAEDAMAKAKIFVDKQFENKDTEFPF